MSLVTEHLDERGVAFEVIPHRRAFTSIQEARVLGVAAEAVLKTVALRSAGKYVLAVVPASRRLELRRVRELLEDPGCGWPARPSWRPTSPAMGWGRCRRWGRCWGCR